MPTIKSWVSNKVSGEPPYTYFLELVFPDLIDGVNYSLESGSNTVSGYCDVYNDTQPNNPSIANELLLTGKYTSNGVITEGSCRLVWVRIRDLKNNVIIQSMFFHISNI